MIEARRKKQKASTLDKYVVFTLTMLILFTITAIAYQFYTKEELSSTLITCFFAAFGGELYMLCMIKKLKLKGGSLHDH